MNGNGSRLISGVTIPLAWRDYNTQDPSGFELTHRPLWFTRSYVDASTVALPFFDTALASDDLFTNIFPYQNSYLMKAFGLYIVKPMQADAPAAAGAPQPAAFSDVQLLVDKGILDIKIGKKDYGPFPLWRLAAGGGVWGVLAGTSTTVTSTGQVGFPDPDSIYKLAIPVVIPAQTQAHFRMRWPAGAANLTGNVDIKLILEGIEAAPRQ